MNLRIFTDVDSVARGAAQMVAAEARAAIAARGRFIFAVSGGRTPWTMLRSLAGEDLPWPNIHIVQVDERIAPAGDPDRNLTHVLESLGEHASKRAAQVYPMPVEQPDLNSAAEQYATTLRLITGAPPVLDLVHLGLGPDGHTASLIPGDPVLQVFHTDVALTGIYQGRRRMTLTYPILNRARQVMWLVTGRDKVEMVHRLNSGDTSIPAGGVQRTNAVILADQAATASMYEVSKEDKE
jgi:6-phosphogluconolactonase